MFAEERQQDIVAFLQQTKKASVLQLSERYNVSLTTIRADLKVLAEQDLIIKTHGGAIIKTTGYVEQISNDRRHINYDSKNKIGKEAAKLIKDRQTVFLDTGTTTYHILPYLEKTANITIVTNDFEIARQAEELDTDKINVILLGGVVKRGYHCTYQNILYDLISRINVDIAFMGANGFSLTTGITAADINLSDTKRLICQHANSIAVVCDHSKIGNTALSQFATIDEISYLVTDKALDNTIIKELHTAGVDVVFPQ